MNNIIILALTLATAFALPRREVKLRNLVVPAGRLKGRITNGRDAGIGDFPYQAGLELERNSSYFWCGGSILNNEWILTAAHCTINVDNVTVMLGGIDRTTAEVLRFASKENIFNHEEYDPDTDEHDIALIKIPCVNYTKDIQPVTLPTNGNQTDYEGEYVTATGWGRIGDQPENTTNKLQWALMQILSHKSCGEKFNIHPTSICTATERAITVCNGDSGGPLVLKDSTTQIGITSLGNANCTKSKAAVYTRVASYLDWMEEKTNGSVTVKNVAQKGDLKKVTPKGAIRKAEPKDDSKKAAPKGDIKIVAPKDDSKKVAPKGDIKKVAPRDDSKKVAPRDDPKKATPKGDIKKVTPKDDVKKVAPKGDVNKVAPRGDPKKVAPKGDIKKVAPKDDVKKVAPKGDVNKVAPRGDPKKVAPKGDIKEVAPKGDVKKVAPKTDVKKVVPKSGTK